MSTPKSRSWVPLADLVARCTRCDHQGAVHTKGADRSGWAIYSATWRNATGACSAPECPCPERTTDTNVQALPPVVTPEVLATLAPLLLAEARTSGPCGHGTGPCGALPTQLYPCGPRCAGHAPGAAPAALREAA
ncbi:hypothetical protein GT755_12300 [Herbidospora sp. NEAU-GS84]|uniref:Uncharacterized protein n=1 Tax=Herbidospora solisilvae TaxID=2696284 RepID=A0A7C9JDP4_9ACTN|nr:hypothetical protein [Herbidospora solisilvae]NAS22463.1 hypothetical protein [Herbidospora solisilvae]